MTQICVSELTIITSDNGLSPERRQAIIWTNAGILSIGPLGTNISEILRQIHTFSFKKMHLKTSSAKWRPFCRGLNVLKSLPLKHAIWRQTSWSTLVQVMDCRLLDDKLLDESMLAVSSYALENYHRKIAFISSRLQWVSVRQQNTANTLNLTWSNLNYWTRSNVARLCPERVIQGIHDIYVLLHGLYSLSVKTSYHQIPLSLEAARLYVMTIV